jgi:hypothetical protein
VVGEKGSIIPLTRAEREQETEKESERKKLTMICVLIILFSDENRQVF